MQTKMSRLQERGWELSTISYMFDLLAPKETAKVNRAPRAGQGNGEDGDETSKAAALKLPLTEQFTLPAGYRFTHTEQYFTLRTIGGQDQMRT
jgi:hypothetical protein